MTVTKPKLAPILTEQRIQAFAEAIVRGESQSAAYRLMHPSSKKWKPDTVHVKASLWAGNDKVQGKVAQLRQDSAKRNETTVDLLDKMHKSAFQMAKETRNPSAMTASTKNLGDLHGLNQNKSKIVGIDENGNEAPAHGGVIEFVVVRPNAD